MARPNKFKSKQELEKLIEAYFTESKSSGRPLTISGLVLALGTCRQTLLDYESKPEFTDTIKRAKLMIENWAEEQLFTNPRTAGIIFNLTNNFGWNNNHREGLRHTEWSSWADMIKEADKILTNSDSVESN